MMTFAPTYIVSLVYLLICCGPAQPDVSLRVSPERAQFFEHETISLSCEEEENPVQGWTVKRQSSESVDETCNNEFGFIEGESYCIITPYPLDSGVYWCQSTSGEVSRSIDITISGGDVILESPVLPVTEGDNVKLCCLSKDKTAGKPSSDLPAGFYKNGSLFSTESTGQMTIHHINKSDEGFYKCIITDLGESPESWMDVTKSSTSDPTSDPTSESEPLITLTQLIIKLLVATPFVMSTILYISILRDRARAAANARDRRDNNDVIMEVAV